MSTASSLEHRERLVRHLRRHGYLSDPQVAAAFLDVPRETFLPSFAARHGIEAVYRDDAIVVRRDESGAPCSSSSQPAIMALMLQMLDVASGQRVLEIGAGTGYNAALLERLVGPDGFVVTVDVTYDISHSAATALRSLNSAAAVLVADGRRPVSTTVPFDRIEVTASSDSVPPAWHAQLAPGGLLVVPLRLDELVDGPHAVTALRRTVDGFDSVAVTGGGFMPLRPPATVGPADVHAEPTRDDDGPKEAATAGTDPPPLNHETLSGARLTVRYGPEQPASQWVIRRADHWIGVDPADRS